MNDLTCMSYWFPKIVAAGLPVPRTTLLTMPMDAFMDIYRLFDGKDMEGKAEPFFVELRAAAADIGFPVFLRTGLTSGKHEWDRTCYVTKAEDVAEHAMNILYFWECCGIGNPDTNIWAVREFLPTLPLGVCPHYDNMPICREFRFFVNDGAIVCWHPYWPRHALERGGVPEDQLDRIYDALCRGGDDPALHKIASEAGRVLGGAWSVDLLETSRGWYLTDMAVAAQSFHWEGCAAAAARESGPASRQPEPLPNTAAEESQE